MSPVTGSEGLGSVTGGVLLGLLTLVYFMLAVFRSASSELNARAIVRILASRGLVHSNGERTGEESTAIRIAADLAHHIVLVVSVLVALMTLDGTRSDRPFLYTGLAVGLGLLVIQAVARLLAISNPEKAFSGVLLVMSLFSKPLYPLTGPIAALTRRLREAGRARRGIHEDAAEEEIEAFIDAGQQEGILEADEGNLIRQVVEFHDSVVREVMTPRTDVIGIQRGATLAQARDLFAKERHSRLPVYRDQIDNVEGVITLKELVARWDEVTEDTPVEKLMLPPYFVPETTHVADLLKELQRRRIQLAIVVDEYGGTAGVVSIEDLLEELVGDIQEEHEQEPRPVEKQPDGSFLAEGSASLDDLEEALGVEIHAKGFETIAGMIYSAVGRIPKVGESIEADGLRLEVVRGNTRRIDRVRVRHLAGKSSA